MNEKEEKYIDEAKDLAKERVVLMSADFNQRTMGDLTGVVLSTNGHSAELLLLDIDEDSTGVVGIINNLCCFDDKICWDRGQVIEISSIGNVKDFRLDEQEMEELCDFYEQFKIDDDENYRKFIEQYPDETLYKRTKKQNERLKKAREWYSKERLQKG